MTVLSETNGMGLVLLPSDTGADIEFTGTLCSENMYHDSEAGTVTRQRLYTTDTQEQIYSIVVSDGINKDQRVYKMRLENDLCRISNGLFDVPVDLPILASVIRELCGLDEPAQTDEFLSIMVENLQAANG